MTELPKEVVLEEDTELTTQKISDLQSPEIDKITAALVAVQKDMQSASKDQANPFYKSKYADLTSIIEASRPELVKSGVVVTQSTMTTAKGEIVLVTQATHTSGQFIRGFYPVRPVQNTPQGFGSAMTYARRYAYAALIGVTQADDDGNEASFIGKPIHLKQEYL